MASLVYPPLATIAEARAWAEAENAQQRILEPAELGPLAVLLSSPEAAGITGQVIGVVERVGDVASGSHSTLAIGRPPPPG